MKNRTYKILVLSDLNESTPVILKSTIGLAKMINGEVDFFHVKKPTEVVKTASQLSAVREINKYSNVADKKIKKLLEPISTDHNLNVNYRYSFGNVKDEIEKHIKKTNPDVIVLGKRKSNPLSFMGDNVTDFVLKTHTGAVMIASNENNIEPNSDLSLGIFNGMEEALDKSLAKNLISYTKTPLKSFKIGLNAVAQNYQKTSTGKKTVEYVFEDNPNAVATLSGYVAKSNVNLLFIDRNNISNKVDYTKDVINKVNVSLLVT